MIDSKFTTEARNKYVVCFNSSKSVLLYAAFPGQKVFISAYHPRGAIQPIKISGYAFHQVNVITKVVEKMQTKGSSCIQNDPNNLEDLQRVYKEYESW